MCLCEPRDYDWMEVCARRRASRYRSLSVRLVVVSSVAFVPLIGRVGASVRFDLKKCV